MSILTLLNVTLNIGALAAAGGAAAMWFALPQHSRRDLLLTTAGCSAGVWAVAALLLTWPDSYRPGVYLTLYQVGLGAAFVTTATFLGFVVFVLEVKGRILQLIAGIIGVQALILGIIMIAQRAMINGDSTPASGTDVYTMHIITSIYAQLAFAISISSDKSPAGLIRWPAVALAAAPLAGLIFHEINPGPMLAAAALLIISIGFVRQQLHQPLDDLQNELRVMNRDLAQAINNLADERDKAQKLRGELATTSEYKSTFLSNISHELRTPLNAIIGYSELLNSGTYGELTEQQNDRLGKINSNGKRLLEIISDMLDLNKLETQNLKLEVAAFSLTPLAERIRAEFQNKCAEKGLTLTVQISDDLPHLFGDEARVYQVIHNLLSNAVKFTEQGAISMEMTPISVRGGNTDGFNLPASGWLHDGDWMIISVTDTGIGIAPENQGRIFEEFAQIDSGPTRPFGGAGMGLAICKHLIELHAGSIWLKSKPGDGTTFFVALPADSTASSS